MTIDYARLAATAERLIEANGKSITLVRKSRTFADATQPHLGYASGETAYAVTAVEKSFKTEQIDGQAIRAGDRLFVIAANSVPGSGSTFIPTEGDVIRISGKDWAILSVTPKSPGSTPLVYEVHARLG